MQKISLIFPMAGQGARFGYCFKPFLTVREHSFIEAAFAPFRPWLARIAKVHFVFTAQQDSDHAVAARLARMFGDVPHACVILDAPTNGPAQTLQKCLEGTAIDGPILVCDCDHAVNVDGLFQTAAQMPDIACAVPTWPLESEDLASWSVAAINGDDRIVAVAEKALPPRGENFRGMIGCYYFSDARDVLRAIAAANLVHVSDIMAACLDAGRPVLSVPVREARFFGDPARLAAENG